MPCRAAPVMPFCCAKPSSEAMTSSPPSRTSRNWRCRAGSNALLFMRANCASFASHDVEKKERRRPRRLAREPLALGGEDAAATAALPLLEGPPHRRSVADAVDDEPPPHQAEVRAARPRRRRIDGADL